MLNDASCDLWCQQFGDESYERIFACLFPAAFCKYRFQDYLFENGIPDWRQSPDDHAAILIAADWHEEIGEYETAMLMRLAVEWQLEPPSEALREIAERVRTRRLRHPSYLDGMRLTKAIEDVFAKYYSS